MLEPEFVIDSKRHLPHKQLTDCILFITWRLAFTLLAEVIKEISIKRIENRNHKESASITDAIPKEEYYIHKHFQSFDTWLDNYHECDYNLITEPFLNIITNAISYDDSKKYQTIAYSIMPNHVHLIIKPLQKSNDTYYTVTEITRLIKGVTSYNINKALALKGQFWQHESYDRIIRDNNEYLKTIKYVIMNPVKAGLIDKWDDWKGTYLSDDYLMNYL